MGEIADDMREGLLALAVGAGLQVMSSLMEADVAAACGPRGKHDPRRTAVRHGSERGSVTLAGVELGSNGRGCVPPVAVKCLCLPMTCSVVARSWPDGDEQDARGLSSRRYAVGLEPVGEKVERAASATSKSRVSAGSWTIDNRPGRAARRAVGSLDLVALMIDGVHFGEHLCVVALGIGIDGTSIPWGWSKAAPRTRQW